MTCTLHEPFQIVPEKRYMSIQHLRFIYQNIHWFISINIISPRSSCLIYPKLVKRGKISQFILNILQPKHRDYLNLSMLRYSFSIAESVVLPEAGGLHKRQTLTLDSASSKRARRASEMHTNSSS